MKKLTVCFANTFFMICIGIIFLAVSSPAFSAEIKDGPIARQQIKKDAQLLLHQEKYDELEKLANTLRKTKARFPNGGWKLAGFYDAFGDPFFGWEELFRNTHKWMKKYPASTTARVAAANAWRAYAWVARGEGYANTVSEQGWKLMGERMAQAYDLIKDDPANSKDDCPYRYHCLLRIALSPGWDRQRYEALFKKAIAYEPAYWGYYIEKAVYLLPRWHGVEGDWQKFASEAAQMTSKRDGMGIYARIIISMWTINEFKAFREPDISWNKTKQGFLDLERRYPKSPDNLNWFCMMSCVAGDKETARKLFKRIGNDPHTNIWNGRSNYEKWKRWAGM